MLRRQAMLQGRQGAIEQVARVCCFAARLCNARLIEQRACTQRMIVRQERHAAEFAFPEQKRGVLTLACGEQRFAGAKFQQDALLRLQRSGGLRGRQRFTRQLCGMGKVVDDRVVASEAS